MNMNVNKVKETTIMQIFLRTGTIFFVSMLAAFLVIYFITKKEFEKRTEKELSSVTEIVKQSITSTQDSTKMLENLADLRLYTISEALGEELKGKTIHDVSREELNRLKMQWGLSEISLFVRKGDDMIVMESTDPKEVGLNARDWGYWYTAMIELLERKDVSVEKGYAAKNYWVGPLSLSQVQKEHYKYAYYYDGTTDFIINPYIASSGIYKMIQTKGTAEFIEKIQKDYQDINEIAVINIPAYLKGKDHEIIEPMTDMPVLYGRNTTKLDEDTAIFQNAMGQSIFKKVRFEKDGREMEKIYISLPEQKMLTVVMSLDGQQTMMKNLCLLFVMVFCITSVGIFIFARMATGKTLKLLAVERERLAVAEDFKRTLEVLPSAIYKCKLEDNGQYILTYCEGPLMEEMGLATEQVKGQYIENIFQHNLYIELLTALGLAYREGRSEFTAEYNEKFYHHILKAVYDLDNPSIVMEIAAYAVDITERMIASEKIHYLAMHDSLTALPNRTYFHDKLESALVNSSEKPAVIFIDLDNFKQVNDTLGHEAGDLLLVQVTERLSQCMEQGAFLSRMGGDEFTVLLPCCADKREAEKFCQFIVRQFQQPFFIMNQELFVTASIGVSIVLNDNSTSRTLLRNADIAMYSAKQNGKNSYQVYTKEMEAYNIRRIEIQKDLRQSLQGGGDLFLVYQPQLSLETNEVVGVEALLRWNHPEKGIISPAEFIPIAEESGLIEQLGDWILREACMQFAAWVEQGLDPIRVSVNLSARQFKNADLAKKICDVLDEAGMPPQYLTLEITESTSMEDISHTTQVIQQLRDIPVWISIDDFGTGYSSLNYLKDFPINHLKIDQSFVRELEMNSAGKAIVKSIIDLALNLKLKVIAEGVETKEEFDMLVQMGCHEIQGYYFSRPVDPEKIPEIVGRASLLV